MTALQLFFRDIAIYLLYFHVYSILIFFSKYLVCKMVSNWEMVGIFGPQEKVTAEYVQSMCDIMEVPHISVRQDSSEPPQPRGLSLNLYPHVSSLSRVSK